MKKHEYKDTYEQYFDSKGQVYQLHYNARYQRYTADVYNGTLIFGKSISQPCRIRIDDDSETSSKYIDEDFLINAYRFTGKNPSNHADCFDKKWFAVLKEINPGELPLNNIIPLQETEESKTFEFNDNYFHSLAYVFKTEPILCSAFILIVAVFIYMWINHLF